MPAPVRIEILSRNARLHASLQSRVIHPSLHYVTAEQAQKWLVIHRKHSPAAQADTIQIYRDATTHVASLCAGSSTQVISLGCGGGNKDMLLLQSLIKHGCPTHYFPCDISEGLVLEASARANDIVDGLPCTPVLCDLESSASLSSFLLPLKSKSITRIFLFFGILPNMEPAIALACLRSLLQPGDHLLISANLAPGPDPEKGVRQVLPQYDNPETHDWLLTLIRDLGFSKDAGRLRFQIETSPGQAGLRQIVAVYTIQKPTCIMVENAAYSLELGDSLRLFFSNRHTPTLANEFMAQLNISTTREWTNTTGDEAVLTGQA